MHMPRLQRLTQFQINIALDDIAVVRETELEEGQEPVAFKRIAGIIQLFAHHILKSSQT
jgi:hypothetical protein